MSASQWKPPRQLDGHLECCFNMDVPIPIYLLAMAVGDIGSKEIGPRSRVWTEPCLLVSDHVTVDHVVIYVPDLELNLMRIVKPLKGRRHNVNYISVCCYIINYPDQVITCNGVLIYCITKE